MKTTKRRRPAPPFLVTIAKAAAAVAVIPGCSTDVFFQNNPPAVGCPDAAPSPGDDCAGEASCAYPQGDGCSMDAVCIDGSWRVSFDGAGCEQPPPTCPAKLPAMGAPCYQIGQTCSYPAGDGCGGEFDAACNAQGQWEIQDVSPPCNPPQCPTDIPMNSALCNFEMTCTYTIDEGCGPETVTSTCGSDGLWYTVYPGTCNPPFPDLCPSYATEQDCVYDPSCQWLVPGCGQAPTLPAGCYSALPCVVDTDCPGTEKCVPADIDPCWNKGCDACSALVQVCVP